MKSRKGNYVMVWEKILDSSVWELSAETRIVWITILCMKGRDGLVRATLHALARRSNVNPEAAAKAVAALSAPDQFSGSKEKDGRRIIAVEGGWRVVNHDKYRFTTDARREYWRIKKSEERERKGLRKRRNPLVDQSTAARMAAEIDAKFSGEG